MQGYDCLLTADRDLKYSLTEAGRGGGNAAAPGGPGSGPDLINTLSGSDCDSRRHGELWDLLSEMWAAGAGSVDPITVAVKLIEHGDVTRLCGPARAVWLHQLHDAVPTVAHAEIVREESQWRALGLAAARTMTAVQQRTGTVVAAAEAAVDSARAVRDQQVQRLDDGREELLDFLDQADDEPQWVIPGVLARWDRADDHGW
ncbi:hypothetical protein [Streptomyces clavifer]|uniref:hypothetical protein n=1 Tax=Streptomyces clavifer TaxID=68188 RepID=UPI0033F76001